MTHHRFSERLFAALAAASIGLGGCGYRDAQHAREHQLAHVSDELELTAAQRAVVAPLLARWSERRDMDRDRMRAEIFAELTSEELDPARLNAKLLSQVKAWEALVPELTEDLARLHGTLTLEQRARLAALSAEQRHGRHRR